MSSFVLLDDNQASTSQPTSRLYTDLQQLLTCSSAAQFPTMIHQMEVALAKGLYAVVAFSYETGVQLQEKSAAELNASVPPSYVLVFKNCQHLSRDQVTSWLAQKTNAAEMAGIAQLRYSVTETQFVEALSKIKKYIAEGDTYQVNFTFRLNFMTYGSIFSVYQRLRERQSVPYGAMMVFPDGDVILSFSPELFLRHTQGKLLARPMKGTAAACIDENGKSPESKNRERSKELSRDPKNRAENVMIVDLLRNDLSRIAQLGSVAVPQLFEVQQFNSVLQMTSTVLATLRDDVDLTTLLQAVFPCGSITGTPKYRTTQIIRELENKSRGIYTGALGWFDPPRNPAKVADFCLSVPIRTVQLSAPSANGSRTGVLGVGAGIVFDSSAMDEFRECQLKARFLTGMTSQFSLLETIQATREQGCRHLERHLSRLSQSAQFFLIPLNMKEIRYQLEGVCAAMPEKTIHRVRLMVNGLGRISVESAALAPLTTPANVVLSPLSKFSQDIWLRHKTTQREEYDRAWQRAEQQGAFDMLFCNERGELTEGGRSNLLVKMEGRWYTPPLSAGVLPGVMRSVVMDDPSWQVTERNMRPEQLSIAQEIAVCSSLRGVLPVRLVALTSPG